MMALKRGGNINEIQTFARLSDAHRAFPLKSEEKRKS